jgi:pimeloyl-ACP methyl ester carboxylesterase
MERFVMLKKFLFAVAMSAALVANGAVPSPLSAQVPVPQPPRFTVVVEGSGPDLILIPGLTSSRHVWDQAVASLGGHYRVHRIQIAGFGGEPAKGNATGPVLAPVVEEIHAYIAANHLHHVMVAGHSVGGLLTLMLAQGHPEDVSRALIVDALPFYPMLFSPDATPAGVEPQAAAMRGTIATMTDDAWRAQQSGTIPSMVSNEAARPLVARDSMASDRSVVARALYDDLVTDVRPGLAAMHMPITIAYAVNERATEAAYGRLVRTGYAVVPNVRFVAVEPSYHFIMLDQPDRFNVILGEFLAGTSHPNN